MSRSSDTARAVALAAAAGGTFALLELAFAPATRPSVGVGASMIVAGVLAMVVAHGAVAWLARRLGARAALVPVALWAAVWGPELARELGQPGVFGGLAPLLLVALGRWRPGAAVGVALLGALPWAAPRPGLARCGGCGDIVLVTVDTVRADAGLPAAAAADSGAWVTAEAITAAPWTPPAVHSLFLGRPVGEHGAGVEREGAVTGRAGEHPGLVEALRERGYRAAGFVSNPHLRQEAGFGRGFSTWAHADRAPAPLLLLRTGRLGLRRWLGARPDSVATDAALVASARRWLASTPPGGRFVWLHLMGPHAWPGVEGAPTDAAAEAAARDRYAEHVQRVGGQLAELWPAVPDDALVVLTSDHGEALGEGARWGHGHALDAVLLRVPLAVRGPRVAALPGTARLTGVRAALESWAAGGEARFAVGEGARVAGVRGSPEVGGRWRAGRVSLGPRTAPPQAPVAPLSAADRTALERLGYLQGAGAEGTP
jgi:hypothetical protein